MREKLIELIMDSGKVRGFAGGLADHLIANGVRLEGKQATSDETSKWIPVSEMMPESHVEPFEDIDGTHYVVVSDFVLGYTDKGEVVVVQHEVGDERDWWLDQYGGYSTVTHWMPLPEPPKGE